MSLISSFLLLQQCPACLVRLIWIVLKIGGMWPYSCCFVGCCYENLLNITCSILLQSRLAFSLYGLSASMWCIHIVELTRPLLGKKFHFILSDKSDFHMIHYLSIVVNAFASRILMSFSVDEAMLLRLMNLSTSFREPPFSVEMFSFFIKTYVLRFVWIHMEVNVTCCLLRTVQLGFG